MKARGVNQKVYLYGAGINCYGAIRFWGRECVVAVIDGNAQKWGKQIDGVKIISLEDYKCKNKGECIIITAYLFGEEIKETLIKNGITSFYFQPYMQGGFPEIAFLFEYYKISSWKSISILGLNPMTERVLEEAENLGISDKVKAIYLFPDKGNELSLIKTGETDIRKYAGEKLETDGVIITEWFGENRIISNEENISVADVFSENFCSAFFPHEELKKFKDIHRNRRCFIIGNGPSLRCEDLERIYENRDISFGMNRVFKIFEKTRWRPDYYVIDDFNAYKNDCLRWLSVDDENMFVREYYNLAGLPDLKAANRYHSTFQNLRDRKPDFTEDISKTIYWGATVTFSVMQIAAYMGFSEIYLIGMDFNYEDRKKGGEGVHFSDEYEKDILFEVNYKREHELSYLSAREYAETHNVKFYNATRGGELEIFERVDFDSLFENRGGVIPYYNTLPVWIGACA